MPPSFTVKEDCSLDFHFSWPSSPYTTSIHVVIGIVTKGLYLSGVAGLNCSQLSSGDPWSSHLIDCMCDYLPMLTSLACALRTSYTKITTTWLIPNSFFLLLFTYIMRQNYIYFSCRCIINRKNTPPMVTQILKSNIQTKLTLMRLFLTFIYHHCYIFIFILLIAILFHSPHYFYSNHIYHSCIF